MERLMTKFEEVLVRIAYVGKLLIGVAGMVATALLGLSDLPAGWKFPLLVVAAVAASVALFKVPTGPSVADAVADRELRDLIARIAPDYPKPDSGGDIE